MTRVRNDRPTTRATTAATVSKSKRTPDVKPASVPASSFNTRGPKNPVDVTGITAAAATSRPAVKLIDNDAYFPELTRLIAGAKKSIDLVQYNFYSESGHGKDLAEQLISMKQQHPSLKIRLFIEADHGDGATRNALTMKKLKDAGIDVEPDSKNLVTHAKVVCVDSRYVLAGSHNLSNTSMDKNNEVSLSIASPTLAKAYEKYFAGLVAHPDQLQPVTAKSGAVTMMTDTAYEAQLLDVIKTAHGTLDASMYDLNFNGHDAKAQEVMDALAAAAKRGVKVNLMLEQGLPSFAPEITAANKAAATWLTQHGVTVHLDSKDQISHQKFIVRDGQEALIGSTNWAASDFDKRHQINWRVRDPVLVGELRQTLLKEIAAVGVPVT